MPKRRTAPVPGPRYEALLQLLRTAETLWNASRSFFERWELGPSQFNLLNLLIDHPHGLSQSELSRCLIMHRSNVTGLVDRLEKRSLVQREPSAEDRRAYCVVLTKAGRQLLEEVLPCYYKAAEEVWNGIPVGRVRSMLLELQRLSDNARSISSSPKTAANSMRDE
jgi:DNA-binding MarR family transcriptional regulator